MISKKRDGSIVTFIDNNFISLKRRGANRISLPHRIYSRSNYHYTSHSIRPFSRDTFAVADDWTLFTRFRFHTAASSPSSSRRPTSLSLSLCLSPSIILLSSSIFHATFNYERLSRCQGDATCDVTEEREKSFSFIGAHAYCTITSRGRTPWLCVQLATK